MRAYTVVTIHFFAVLFSITAALSVLTANAQAPSNALPKETQEPIVIVVSNWPPYAIEHSKTMQQGMDVEVTLAAFNHAGIKGEIRFFTWSRCLEEIQAGRATAILEIADVPIRREHFLVSHPLSRSTSVFLVRKDYNGPPITVPEMLRGLNVAVVNGYASTDQLDTLNIAYDLSHNEEIAIRKVADKRLDVALLEFRNMKYLLAQIDIEDRFKWFAGNDTFSFHLGINKHAPNAARLLAAFNNGLESIIKDGTYDEIHARYQ